MSVFRKRNFTRAHVIAVISANSPILKTRCEKSQTLRKQDSAHNIQKVNLEGRCDDKYCRFAHSLDELRHTDNLFKTSLCIQFEKGMCKSSEHCRYAHGYAELRKLNTSSDSDEKEPVKETLTRRNGNNGPCFKNNFYSECSDSLSVSSEQSYDELMERKSPMLYPAKFRYNYLNPFYFYTINNFPIQHSVSLNQTVLFFNYIAQHGSNCITSDTPKFDLGMLSTKSDSGIVSKQQLVSDSNTNNVSPLRKTDNVTRS